ncbi:MAG: hypothetical protein ACXWTX_02420 [Gallionella sp.]
MNKLNTQWLGTAVLVMGAFVVSVWQNSALDWPVFVAFLAGHAVLIVDSISNNHRPYLFLNGCLAAMDIYAIAIRIHS